MLDLVLSEHRAFFKTRLIRLVDNKLIQGGIEKSDTMRPFGVGSNLMPGPWPKLDARGGYLHEAVPGLGWSMPGMNSRMTNMRFP